MQIFQLFLMCWLSGQSLACPLVGMNKYGVCVGFYYSVEPVPVTFGLDLLLALCTVYMYSSIL